MPANDDRTDPTRRILLAAAAAAPALLAGMAQTAEAASADAGMPAGLAAAVAAYDRATIARDIAALSALVTDDYLLVNSDASVQDKPSYLADFELSGFEIEPYTVTQPVLKVWNCAAVSGGLMHLRWTQDGARHDRRLRIAHVWTKDRGRWRIAYTQLTRVPDGAAAA